MKVVRRINLQTNQNKSTLTKKSKMGNGQLIWTSWFLGHQKYPRFWVKQKNAALSIPICMFWILYLATEPKSWFFCWNWKSNIRRLDFSYHNISLTWNHLLLTQITSFLLFFFFPLLFSVHNGVHIMLLLFQVFWKMVQDFWKVLILSFLPLNVWCLIVDYSCPWINF